MAEPLPVHRSREYETIFIVHPETAADRMDQIAERVTDVISRLNGKLLKAENWGKRRLAYPVKKQQSAYYVYVRYLGYADMVHEIERNFRMLEPVIKYITVKVDEDVNPDARPVVESEISFVPQVEEEPEEAPVTEAAGEDDEQADAEGSDDDADSADDDSSAEDEAAEETSAENEDAAEETTEEEKKADE